MIDTIMTLLKIGIPFIVVVMIVSILAEILKVFWNLEISIPSILGRIFVISLLGVIGIGFWLFNKRRRLTPPNKLIKN